MENELIMDVTIQTLLELLEAKKYSRARDEILKNNTVDIAEILEEVIAELGIEKASTIRSKSSAVSRTEKSSISLMNWLLTT